MASGESKQKGVEKEDEDFEDGTIASAYLSISGSTSSTIRSDISLIASINPDKLGVEKEDEDFEDDTIASAYLSISGSTSSTIRSDITLLASREPDTIGVEKEDEDFEDDTIASAYLSISGSQSNTIRSDITLIASREPDNIGVKKKDEYFEDDAIASAYLSISGSKSNTIRSDITSFSCPYLSIRGTEFTHPDSPSVNSTINPEIGSDDVSTIFNDLQLVDSRVEGDVFEDKPVKSGRKLCSNCIIDGKETNATHLCKDCKPGGRYICHKCLQGHNRWSEEHVVVSLSVKEQSSIRSGKETNEDSNELMASSEEPVMTYHEEYFRQKVISDTIDVSEVHEIVINDTKRTEIETHRDKSNVDEQVPDRSGTLYHPKMRMLRRDLCYNEKDPETAEKDMPCYLVSGLNDSEC